MKTTKILATAAVAVLLGCTENISTEEWDASDGRITFAPAISADMTLTRSLAMHEDKAVRLTEATDDPLYIITSVQPRVTAATRGTLVNDVENDLTALGNFGISGYRYTPATQSVQDVTANFFYNVEVKEALGEWTTNEPYYYPGANDRLTFYAYSPYAASFGTTDVTAITGNGEAAADYGPMTLTYTVSPTLEDQTDLMVATADTQFNPGKKVSLPFRHALTAIRFQLGKDVAPTWTIESLNVNQVINSAKYKVGTGWQYSASTRDDFALSFTSKQPDGKALSDEDKQLMAAGEYFLMIPQSFTDDDDRQCFAVVLKNTATGRERRFTYPLKGTTWAEGTVINYTISTSSVNEVQAAISYPAKWGDEAFELQNAYADGEAVGVYAVDINTHKVVTANMKLTYNQATGTWNTEGDRTLKYNSNYDYYFYYPYKSNINDGLDDTFNGSGASDFFSGVISNWTVTDDQSTADKLLPNDLHIGQAVHDTENFMHVSVAMSHALGLAKITLETKDVTPRVHLASGNTAAYSGSYRIDLADKLIYRASNQDIKDYMCPNSDAGIYYYIVKGTQSKTFSSSSTGDDAWKSSLTGTLVNGECYTALAELKTTPTLVEYDGWFFDYTGGAQELNITESGLYQIECWGASGGAGDNYQGGTGGYVRGDIYLTAGETYYIYIGGEGQKVYNSDYGTGGGWNGGGNGINEHDSGNRSGAGGGATDIRLVEGSDWDDFASLKSRIMVAGAGGGACMSDGGGGGGLTGLRAEADSGYPEYNGSGGTQTSGATCTEDDYGTPISSSFGCGSVGLSIGGGGGGGWYGGAGGTRSGPQDGSGGGGSSFISGHEGCNSISALSTASNITHTGSSTHYSGKVFTNTRMIDGAGYEWTTTAGTTVVGVPQTLAGGYETAGHTGNGFVRIIKIQ